MAEGETNTSTPEATPNTDAVLTALYPTSAKAEPTPVTDAKADGKTEAASTADATKQDQPTDYTFNFGEGLEVDEASVTEFKGIAKELGLSQEQAQKLVDLQQKLVTANSEANQDAFYGILKEWRDNSTSDKEFGGKDFQANLGLAKKALDKYGSPELKQALETTGMGNHPELIRLLYRVGKTLPADKVNSGSAHEAYRDPAKVLFPNMN